MAAVKFTRKSFRTFAGRECIVTYGTVRGSRPGPVLTVIAGQHGMEHSGPNLLPWFMEEISREDFAGTLHICPCANPLALEIDYEIYPEREDLGKLQDYYYSRFRHEYCVFGLDRSSRTMYNMNRLWNCRGIHGVAGEITAWLWREICVPADVTIDLHCLQSEKPLIFNGNSVNNPVARYFGVEAIFMTNPQPDDYNRHNLLYQVNTRPGHYGFCVEFSLQHGLRESEYPLGKRGLRNIMQAMRMLPGEIIHDRPVWIIPYGASVPVKAGASGHIRYCCELYDRIAKGDRLYEIRDIQTLAIVETAYAPLDGILCGKNYLPVMKSGATACTVAAPELAASAGEKLEKLPAFI